MKKNILKNERGITLVVLMLVIIIMTILVGAVVTNIDTGSDIRNYQYMRADIELLESKILTYYNKTGTLPTIGEGFEASGTLVYQVNSNDNEIYYQIDMRKLNNITLNYGGGTKENGDIYIVNEQSHNVYYLKGAMFENEIYHTYARRNGSSCVHTFGNWVVTIYSTCTEKGERERECTKCSYVQRQQIEELGHAYGEWEIYIAGGCGYETQDGVDVRTCTRCGNQEFKEIPAEHNWNLITDVSSISGFEHAHVCDDCYYFSPQIAEPTSTYINDTWCECNICGARHWHSYRDGNPQGGTSIDETYCANCWHQFE